MRPSIVERIVTPLERARGQLSQYSADTKVVIQATSKQTGKSRTLFAHGGIEAGDIPGGGGFGGGSFGGFAAAQMESQYNDDETDWYDDGSWEDWNLDVEEY
jgi:hypothetical protein